MLVGSKTKMISQRSNSAGASLPLSGVRDYCLILGVCLVGDLTTYFFFFSFLVLDVEVSLSPTLRVP